MRCIKYLVMLFCLFSLVACQKSEEEPKSVYNSVITDPKFLENLKQTKITMIAPGSKMADEKIELLKQIPGINLVVPEGTFSEDLPYHSNSDEGRFKALEKALTDESSENVLWSLRGGYGSSKLIAKLATLSKPEKPKILIGYSDITVLHLFLSQQWGWKTIHGAMLTDLLKTNRDPENFQKLAELLNSAPSLTNSNYTLDINQLSTLNQAAKQDRPLKGKLTGGNLAMIETSIGTPWQIITENKILFLEDDGEKGYKIDRMLEHLKQAGLLNKVNAIIFGDFTDGDEYSMFAIQRFADENSIPIFKTDEFGHGIKNYPLIINANSTIEKSDKNDGNYRLTMQLND